MDYKDFNQHSRLRDNKWLLHYFLMRLRTLRVITSTQMWAMREELNSQPTHANYWLQ